MTDLNAMLLFARVIHEGSFAKAARHLKMPTSTLSRRIADLERQLHVRLIDRSTRSLKLTSVGEAVLEQARHIADLSQSIEALAAQHTSKASGTLRLSAPPSISDSLLVPLLQQFQEQYPEVSVQVSIAERVLDPVLDDIDLALRVVPEKETTPHSQSLLRYRHVLACSPGYLASRQAPQNPPDLLDHRLLTFSLWRPRKTWTLLKTQTREAASVSFEPYLCINEYAGLMAGMLAGIGIGEVPPIVRPELLRQGLLVPVMKDWRFRRMHLRLQNPGRRQVSRHARIFQEFAPDFTSRLFPEFAVKP